MSPQMRISYNLAEGEKARSKNYFAPISFLFLNDPVPMATKVKVTPLVDFKYHNKSAILLTRYK